MVEVELELGICSEEEAEVNAMAETAQDITVNENANITQEIRIVEALLFAATEPVGTDFLMERLPAGTDIGAVLEHLQKLYEGRGVNLTRVAGKWLLRTAEDLLPSKDRTKDKPKAITRCNRVFGDYCLPSTSDKERSRRNPGCFRKQRFL